MASKSSETLGQQPELPRAWNRFWALRHRRAMTREADYLDDLVDAELEFMRQLPADQRDRPAQALALLVLLAQDYRHYGQGWISRRELRRRVDRTLTDLDALRQAMQIRADEPLS